MHDRNSYIPAKILVRIAAEENLDRYDFQIIQQIAIPNGVSLNCISWNRDQGWIACGGDAGLLKVLKLEVPTGPDAKLQGIAASSNLSMNQTLEGHTGAVMCVTWNPLFRKLTTSDESGLIIVWMLHKGLWYEEMINNRNKSVVRDMKWSSDGRKIAIVYEDGAVIVGSVDGNRLWGKELNLPLRFVEWSPDGRLIVFVTLEAEVWVYDQDGVKVRAFNLVGQDHSSLGSDVAITGIHWFSSSHSSSRATIPNGSNPLDFPATLCIALENGKIQLCRGDDESSSELLDTEFTSVTFCKWSTKGNILAVVGSQKSSHPSISSKDSSFKVKNSSGNAGESSNNLVRFYDSYGRFLRQLKIPGDNISAVSWEGGDLRLSLAVDSFIYFANVRHSYQWAYFLNSVVYAYPRNERRETAVVFWDLISQESHTKYVSNLKFLAAAGDLCAVVICEKALGPKTTRQTAATHRDKKGGGGDSDEEDFGNKKSPGKGNNTKNDIYTIQLRNSIGAVVDAKVINFVPKHISMSPYHVTVSNDRTVYTWQFQSAVARSGMGNALNQIGDGDDDIASGKSPSRMSSGKVRMFDIQNTSFSTAQSPETFVVSNETMADPILCTAMSDKYLIVGRKSGTIARFNLPHLTQENVYTLRDREPVRMEFNCTSSKLGVIDSNGLFTILDLDARVTMDNSANREEGKSADPPSPTKQKEDARYGANLGPVFGRKMNVDRKDVWDMRWAEDDADMVVVMEKTKMVVFNHEVAEDPCVSSGYLARFRDLEIRVVTLDAIMQAPDKVTKDCVVDFESKSLREVRDKITAEGIPAGYSYAEKHPHPRLWKLLASAALEDMNLEVAEKAFVHCGDYYGIQLVKQLLLMPDKMKARAEAAVYLAKYDEAENIYREIDRKDLAIQLRKRLGDYLRVMQLLQTGGGNDALIKDSWDKIGDHYADRYKWKKATQYYQLSRNLEMLAECHYRLENFEELAKLRIDVPDDSPLLITLAKRFESVGMQEEAVDCYLRSTRPPKEAVDCCVLLNKWEQALSLAEQYDYPQVEGLLIKYAMGMINNDNKLQAVELFRVANKPTEAAILIADIADTVATRNVNPALAKKLHVLSALEIERHRKRAMDNATQQATAAGGNIANTTAATLENLMMTALDTQQGAGTLGGTLAATLGATLGGGTLNGGQNNKKLSRAFGNAWRGAAAYHYYMLSLRHFYTGNFDAAMKTAIKLCEYDDILQPRSIYSLLCLTALKNKFYSICSKAFVKLETLPNISEVDRDIIQTLAVKVFIDNNPVDPAVISEVYLKCLDVGRSYKACVISGRAIQESPFHMCKSCRHQMLENELENYKLNGVSAKLQHCPLCHSPLLWTAPVVNPGHGHNHGPAEALGALYGAGGHMHK